MTMSMGFVRFRASSTLSHPSVCVRLGDDPLGLVQFGAMHFEERGIRPEVRTVRQAFG